MQNFANTRSEPNRAAIHIADTMQIEFRRARKTAKPDSSLSPSLAHHLPPAGDRTSVASTDSVGSTRSAGSGQSSESNVAHNALHQPARPHDTKTVPQAPRALRGSALGSSLGSSLSLSAQFVIFIRSPTTRPTTDYASLKFSVSAVFLFPLALCVTFLLFLKCSWLPLVVTPTNRRTIVQVGDLDSGSCVLFCYFFKNKNVIHLF